jgi:hypothetical protein
MGTCELWVRCGVSTVHVVGGAPGEVVKRWEREDDGLKGEYELVRERVGIAPRCQRDIYLLLRRGPCTVSPPSNTPGVCSTACLCDIPREFENRREMTYLHTSGVIVGWVGKVSPRKRRPACPVCGRKKSQSGIRRELPWLGYDATHGRGSLHPKCLTSPGPLADESIARFGGHCWTFACGCMHSRRFAMR